MTTTFTYKGHAFHFVTEPEQDSPPPWSYLFASHDLVSDWATRSKRPGELVLNTDHLNKRFYDFQGACKIALAEGWYTPPYNTDKRETPRQQAAKAALADFKRLKAWCDDEWYYIGLVVWCEDSPDVRHYMVGIESDSGEEYILECAHNLAEDILATREHARRNVAYLDQNHRIKALIIAADAAVIALPAGEVKTNLLAALKPFEEFTFPIGWGVSEVLGVASVGRIESGELDPHEVLNAFCQQAECRQQDWDLLGELANDHD